MLKEYRTWFEWSPLGQIWIISVSKSVISITDYKPSHQIKDP
jgi:hypothetical protein